MNLGIDFGTSRTVIYSVGEGVVLDEPSVIAVDGKDGHLIACGQEAEKMLGRTPDSIRAVRPVQQGVIAEYQLAELMLRSFLKKVCSNRLTKPCAAVSIPEIVTEVERRPVIEAVKSAGARRVTLVAETIASAIGSGIDVTQPSGNMVVNIGAGTTDVSVLSLKGVAVSHSIRVAGDAVDEAIVRYIRSRYGLVIGLPTAERVKIAVGGLLPHPEPATTLVKGRDSLSGLPRTQTVTEEEIRQATQEPWQEILATVQQVLETTPPELAGDLIRNGIVLTGGMARTCGLPECLGNLTGIACRVADDPEHSVAIGAGMALQYASSFSSVYDLGDFTYRLSDSVTN